MITFTIVLSGLVLFFACFCLFMGWVMNEHLTANKYRHLIQLYNHLPKEEVVSSAIKEPRWKFTYKTNKKRKELIVAASTDSAALAQFIKITNGKYDSIQEMVSI
jgi:hypothetical protein